MAVNFVRQTSVHSIEPIVRPTVRYPEHAILLALVLHRDAFAGPIEVHPPVPHLGLHTLVALRPEESRRLAHQLLRAADSLDSQSPGAQILPFVSPED